MKNKSAGTEPMRPIPQVDKILRHPLVEREQARVRREVLAELTRRQLSSLRQAATSGGAVPELDAIAAQLVEKVDELLHGGIKKVLNGTGVILNTNLGRAPLPIAVVERLNEVLPGYCSLEIDLGSGKRGERVALLEELLQVLTGCEAAIVVNNNAAAVMLAVTSLAHGKEVIVSRGELIEIGGSFRLPDVITSAGGILKEVGTTNRTRVDDYRRALSSNTGLILRCHRSNFEIRGFVEQPTLAELVALAQDSGVPFAEDLGSGALIDLSALGLKDEPTVTQVLGTGADLVMFSGDKLLGGLQAGLVTGKASVVERLRKHPIYRALRADKLILSVLEKVLAQYLAPAPEKTVPALRMAFASVEELKERADRLAAAVNKECDQLNCGVTPTSSALGGGTLPGEALASFGLQIRARSGAAADKFAHALRTGKVPLVPIVADATVIVDLRTISASEETLLHAALQQLNDYLKNAAASAEH